MPVDSTVNEVPNSVEPSDQQSTVLFDTSEADAILGGATPNESTPVDQIGIIPLEEDKPSDDKNFQLTPENIASLRKELGLDDNAPAPTEDGVQFGQDYVDANEKFKASTGLNFGDAIDKYMQATVGMDLKSTIETVQQMSAYINKRQGLDAIDQQKLELQGEWGTNFDTYFQLAQQQYSTLSDDVKQKIDALGTEGAKLLLDRALRTTNVPQIVANPFGTLRSSTSPQQTVTVGQQPTLRLSEIIRMPPEKYNSSEVQQALATGNFIRDINN